LIGIYERERGAEIFRKFNRPPSCEGPLKWIVF
jgi:hypothetical protein